VTPGPPRSSPLKTSCFLSCHLAHPMKENAVMYGRDDRHLQSLMRKNRLPLFGTCSITVLLSLCPCLVFMSGIFMTIAMCFQPPRKVNLFENALQGRSCCDQCRAMKTFFVSICRKASTLSEGLEPELEGEILQTDAMIFSRVRALLGGRYRFAFSAL
jgi:hypothetical protein